MICLISHPPECSQENLICGLSVVKIRTGWEEFEAEFGADAKIEMNPNETSKKIGWKERNRRKRERKCIWILREEANETRVKLLVQEIEKTYTDPEPIIRYCYAISWGFQYLCDNVHVYLTTKVKGRPNLRDLTDEKVAHTALTVFANYKYVELSEVIANCNASKNDQN